MNPMFLFSLQNKEGMEWKGKETKSSQIKCAEEWRGMKKKKEKSVESFMRWNCSGLSPAPPAPPLLSISFDCLFCFLPFCSCVLFSSSSSSSSFCFCSGSIEMECGGGNGIGSASRARTSGRVNALRTL